MKQNTHPFLIDTKIQLKDGSIYKKRWLFFRSILPLEVDVNSHALWKKEVNDLFKNKLLERKTSKNN